MGCPSRLRGGWLKQKKIRKCSHLFRDFSRKKRWKIHFSRFFSGLSKWRRAKSSDLDGNVGAPTWSVAEVWNGKSTFFFVPHGFSSGFSEDLCPAKFEAIAAASVWIWPGWKTFPSVTRLRVAFQESQAQETIEENRPQRQDQETQDWWNVVFANCWFISRGHESVGTLLLSKQPYSRRNKLAGSKWFENCENYELAGWMFSW